MPAPIGVYVAVAVASVAAGYVIKKFVYDPFIAPELERLREDIRRRRLQRAQQQGSSSTNIFDNEYRDNDGDMREADNVETRSTIELENLVSQERSDWRDNWRGFVDPSSELRHRNTRTFSSDSGLGRQMVGQPDVFIPHLPMSPTMSTLSFDHQSQSVNGTVQSPRSVATSIAAPIQPPIASQIDMSIRRPLQASPMSSLDSSLIMSHGLPTPRSFRSPEPHASDTFFNPSAANVQFNSTPSPVSLQYSGSNIVSPAPISRSASMQTFNTAQSSLHNMPDLVPDTGSHSRLHSPFSDAHSVAFSRADMTSPFSIAEPSDIETMSSASGSGHDDSEDDDELLSQQFQSAISGRSPESSIRTPSEISFSSSVPDLDSFSENSWENMSASGSAAGHR